MKTTIDRVFLAVDVQHDFCDPSGSLYVQGSPNDLYRALTRFAAERGIPILGSVDSHAWDAWEFASNTHVGPKGEEPNFPDHCVKGTPGWLKIPGTLPSRFRFIPNVAEAKTASIVDELGSGATQAVYFEKEVYSLFANPLTDRFLRELSARAGGMPEVIVYGVATDYCVKGAVLGLLERGYRTVVVADGIAAVTPAGGRQAIEELLAAGARFETAEVVMR